MEIAVSIDIGAPPQRVLEVLHDVERWPEWTASMTSVERLDGGPLATGSRARIRQPKLPAVTWTVTQLDPTAGFTWEARSPGVHTVAEHAVSATGDGSHVRLRLQQRGPLAPLISLIAGRRSRRYVEMEAAGLKTRCEAA